MRKLFITCIQCLLVSLITAQVPALWGHLEKGKYNVGFRSIQTYDLSRPPLHEQKFLPAGQQQGRSMQVNVWYPAGGKQKKMDFADYLRLTTQEINFKADVQDMKQLCRMVANEQLQSHEIVVNQEGLQQFLREIHGMEAMRNAPLLPGKFPVIIIGPETAFKWCIMAEYISSHGYIVITTPLAGSSEKSMDFNRSLFNRENFVMAQESSIQDLKYLMSMVRNFSTADPGQLGILGYSSGITAGLGLITSGEKVKAVVSLEGSIGGYMGPEELSMTTFYSPYLLTAPVLHIFTPSFGYDHYWIENEYRYASRTIIAAYPVRHEDFTSYGALEKYIADISGKMEQPPQLAFETAALYTLRFFDAHIKKDAAASEFMKHDLMQNNIESAFQEAVPDEWKGIKRYEATRTLDEYQLNEIYDDKGWTAIKDIFRELSTLNPRPFSKTVYYMFGTGMKVLSEKEEWFGYYTSSYPEAAEAFYLLGRAKEALNKKEEAAICYKKTLELFSSTRYVLLEDIFKKNIISRMKRLEQ